MESLGQRKRKANEEDDEEDEEEVKACGMRTRRKSSDALQYLSESLKQRATDAAEERRLKEREMNLREEELNCQRDQQRATSAILVEMVNNQQQLMAGFLREMQEKRKS